MQTILPIWFDIDGTLLHTHVGHGAFRMALREVFGWEDDLSTVVFAGNTDLRVLLDMVEKFGGCPHATASKHAPFFEVMTRHLDAGLHADRPRPVPGAAELVAHLQTVPHVVCGLLTGNARACAEAKLRHAGFPDLFRHGGFGDEHPNRDILAVRARERLRESHPGATFLQGLVVGDTPRDVQAAKAIRARCLGVASGSCSAGDLLAAGADRVVEHLYPESALLDWILSDS
jgi:phosphoglycolate phosphatase-like HAD superfamily hydrolase